MQGIRFRGSFAFPLPEVTVSGVSGTCQGTSVSLVASGASSYTWNTGNTGETLQIFSPMQAAEYRVTGTSENGCVSTATHTLTVYPLPNPSVSGVLSICQGDTAVYTATGGSHYLWSTGDTTATVSLTSAQTYTVLVTDANACTATAEKTLTVNSAPTVNIVGQTYLCEHGNTTLYATGTGAVSFAWDENHFGQSLVVTEAGTYTVEATSMNSCTATASVTVSQLPNPQVFISGNVSFCEGESTLLTASGGQNYSWYNAYGVQISETADVTVSEGGSYSVTVTDANTCSSSQQVTATKKNLPSASIWVTDDEICAGEQVILRAGGSSGYSYQWSTGSTDRQITVNAGGTYVLQVTSNGCTAVDSAIITVHPLPEVYFTGQDQLCQGDTITLHAVSPTAVSYLWNTNSTEDAIRVHENGTYSVTVRDAQGCQKEASTTVMANPLPNVAISGPSVVCAGSKVTLTATGATAGYQWSSGESTAELDIYPVTSGTYQVTAYSEHSCSATATAYVAVNKVFDTTVVATCCRSELPYRYHDGSYTQSGRYDVHLTTVNGCDSLVHLQLTVWENPSVAINGNAAICPGATTQLYATSNAGFSWNTGETYSPISVSTSGWYVLTATDLNGCQAYDSVYVEQLQELDLSVSGDLSFCDGQSTLLTASGGQSYTWKNAFGMQISTEAEVTLSESGAYMVTATDAHGCTASRQISVMKKNLPIVSIWASNNMVCEGTRVQLNAGWSSGYSYLWGNGATERQIAVFTSGSYKLQVTANGCTAVDSIDIYMYPLPDIAFSGDTLVCSDHSATIYATAPNAISYLWSTGDTANYISVAPVANTTYGVTVENSYGCVAHETVLVKVGEVPQPVITGPDSICLGSQATLRASGGLYFRWDNDSISAERTVFAAGSYEVTAFSASGCSASAQKNIYTYEELQVVIDGKDRMCMGDSVLLTAHGAVNYVWSNGNTDTAMKVFESGMYWVEGWDNHACSARDSMEISVHPLPTVEITGNHSGCSGNANFLTATSPTAVSYRWNNGKTAAQIQVEETAEYAVVVSDANSCSATGHFFFELSPSPACSILGRTELCRGDTTILTASNGVSFFWSTGAATPSIRVIPASTQNITLIIFDENGCSSSSSVQVVVNEFEPIVIQGDDGFCTGDSVLLVAHASGPLVWSTGHQGDSVIVYETGDYTVQAEDPAYCLHPATKHVEKHSLPDVRIDGASSLCEGDTTSLRAVCDETVNYQWTTGASDSTIKVHSTAVYGVSVTNTYGCVNDTSLSVTVYQNPSVEIAGPSGSSVCKGTNAVLTALGDLSRFEWSTGDTTASISVTPQYETSYHLLAFNQYGCASTATYVLSVNPIPAVTITGDTVLCEGESSVLTSSNAHSFQWSTGSTNRSINVFTSGLYTVNAFNLAGCSNSASVYVHVYEYPNVNILGDSILCQGEQTVLTATGGSGYLWDDGSTAPSITVSPETSTNYSVQVFNAHCVSEAICHVVVNEKPNAVIEAPDGLCEGSSVTLSAHGGAAYLWSTGQNASTINVQESGTYQLVAISQNSCTDTTSVMLTQYPNPQVVISGPSAICEGAQIALTAVGNGSFLWSTGDTSSSITVNQNGQYQVQITDNMGCTATVSHEVTPLSTPVVIISGTSDICEHETATLNVFCSNTSHFNWNTGETTSNIEVTPSNTTTYSVTATSADNCTVVQNHTLKVHPQYYLSFEAEICRGHSYAGQGFNIPVQTTGGTFVHTDTLTSSYGCDSVRSLRLTVNTEPVISNAIFGNGNVSSLGNHVYMIDPVAEADHYEWILSNPNWQLSFNQTIAQVSVTSPGIAMLSVYAINDCGQSQPVSIQISYMTGVEETEKPVVQVFPNPTDGMINVQWALSHESESRRDILLFDMYGKLLNEWKMDGENKQLDLSPYAAGVYLLKLRDSRNTTESRVKIIRN